MLESLIQSNREVILERGAGSIIKLLGNGVYGFVALASIPDISPNVIAIKMATGPVAEFEDDDVYRLDSQKIYETTREYELMTSLPCSEAEGVTVCPLGIFGLRFQDLVYSVIAMEPMDYSVKSFLEGTMTEPANIKTRAALVMMLKIIRLFKKLHREGLYHMDGHIGNILIKFNVGAQHPLVNADVRFADFGLSCGIDPKTWADMSCESSPQILYSPPELYEKKNAYEYLQMMAGGLSWMLSTLVDASLLKHPKAKIDSIMHTARMANVAKDEWLEPQRASAKSAKLLRYVDDIEANKFNRAVHAIESFVSREILMSDLFSNGEKRAMRDNGMIERQYFKK